MCHAVNKVSWMQFFPLSIFYFTFLLICVMHVLTGTSLRKLAKTVNYSNEQKNHNEERVPKILCKFLLFDTYLTLTS